MKTAHKHNQRRQPHIDPDGQCLLLGVLSGLVTLRDAEQDPARSEQLSTITSSLGRIIERYEPPQGDA